MTSRKARKAPGLFLVLIVALVGTAGAFDPSAGLIGHWALDETSGTVAADSSASGNHGTVNGGSWTSEGKIGGALGFDGSDDYIITPGDEDIDFGTGSFTFALWLKTATSGQRYYIANNRTGGLPEAASIRSWSDNEIQAVLKDDAGNITTLSVPDANFVTGDWVHVVGVRDSLADQVLLYVDKVLQGRVTDNSVVGVNPMTDGLAFGVDTDGWLRYLSGQLDDIRVYNRALSQNDVNALYLLSELSPRACNPRPSDKASETPTDTFLNWTPGSSALWHDVYFGTDFDDVNEADTILTLGVYRDRQNLEANTYDPCGPLDLGKTYYWRIDQVNDTHPNSPWRGAVWSFTVVNHVVVDDMESYDQSANRIWQRWLDGSTNGTGSSCLLGIDPNEPVHAGAQSMAFFYDNNDVSGSQKYSEIASSFADPCDWRTGGVRVLNLWFYGDPNNDANGTERMYAALEDAFTNAATVAYDGDANDVKTAAWREWNIALEQFNGVDLSNVKNLYIGFGDRDNPQAGGSGVVYFDDIRLYICRSGGLDADINGDCVVDFRDVARMAGQWLGSGALETDLCQDGEINFKDYSLLADSWLQEQLWVPDDRPAGYQAGLVWVQFHSPDFTRPAGVGVDSQVNIDTGTSIYDYSRIWRGWLKVPTNAQMSIEAEADDGLRLWIGDECIIDGWAPAGERAGALASESGALVPVRLEYYQNGGVAFIRLYWSWACHRRELIPPSAFLHTGSDACWVRDVNNGLISVHEDNSSIYRPGSEARKSMAIRPGPHLFIGDYLIESSQGVARQVIQPRRDSNIPNPLVTGLEDRNFQPYLTVLRDPNRQPNNFRIWYGARTDNYDTGSSHIGYLESADGVNWIRPALILDPYPIQFGCSVVDRGPQYPNLTQRYKYGYYYDGGLCIGVSPDGLTWQRLVPNPVLRQNHDITGIFWDMLRACYVATVSVYTTGSNWSGNRRVTMQSFSDDLIHWQVPWYVLTPDDSSDEGETQFYAMDGYLVRGPLIIGMVKVLRDDLVAEPPVDPCAYGIGYTTLAWTLDGRHWVRDQEIFFDRDHSTDPIPWDHAHAWIDEQLIVGDEVYLYYGGYKQGHKVNCFEERQIGLVKMPLDRYVARKAEGETPGVLTTVPLLMDSYPGQLVVNVDASAGWLRVQVRDANSGTIIEGLSFADCTPITGDGLQLEVRWGSKEQTLQKLANLAGQAVKFEFELDNAGLFAFEFVDL